MSSTAKEQELQQRARFKSGEAFHISEVASDLRVSVSRARGILHSLVLDGLAEKVDENVYKKRSATAELLRRKWV